MDHRKFQRKVDKIRDEEARSFIANFDAWFVRPQGGLFNPLRWGVVSLKTPLGESLYEFETEQEAAEKCKELESVRGPS